MLTLMEFSCCEWYSHYRTTSYLHNLFWFLLCLSATTKGHAKGSLQKEKTSRGSSELFCPYRSLFCCALHFSMGTNLLSRTLTEMWTGLCKPVVGQTLQQCANTFYANYQFNEFLHIWPLCSKTEIVVFVSAELQFAWKVHELQKILAKSVHWLS